MRHFSYLDETDRARLFLREPEPVDADADPAQLAVALGATLYLPATRPRLATDIARQGAAGARSMVVCLEDAIADDEVVGAEGHLARQISELVESGATLPLLFVRVRAAPQIAALVSALGPYARALTGFVLPKFGAAVGPELLDEVAKAGDRIGRRLYAMPVLESAEIAHVETRLTALMRIRQVLDAYRDQVLAVRIGGTDLSSAYGLRRPSDVTIYDVRVLADVIADIVNLFARADGGWVATGPVWEYFGIAGLRREAELDRVNGLIGKSVIHPAHVRIVNALYAVTAEEYADARDVLTTVADGGAAASPFGNKMNEGKPHAAWARRTLLRATAFGVLRDGVGHAELAGAGP
jgi:citrate lyase beta subunit